MTMQFKKDRPSMAGTTGASGPGASGGRRRQKPRGLPPVRGLLPLAVGLAIWQLVADPASAYFPSPSAWVRAIWALWEEHSLASAVLTTAKTFIIALALVSLIGTTLGWLIGRSRLADRLLGPLLEFLRVMPPAAIVPIAVLFGGYNDTTKTVVVIMTAVWPILLQVRTSSKNIPTSLLDISKAMHLGSIETFRKVLLPSITPGILVGIRVAAPIALISTLLVELLTNIPGVGALLQTAQTDFQAATVYGLVAVAGILGITVSALLYLVEAAFSRYTPGRQM